MKRISLGSGVCRYEPDEREKELEAVILLAKKQAAELDDEEAAQVAALYGSYQPGKMYLQGQRVRDAEGNLYRIEDTHIAVTADTLFDKSAAVGGETLEDSEKTVSENITDCNSSAEE